MSVDVASVFVVVPVVILAKLMFVALIEQLASTCTETSKLVVPLADRAALERLRLAVVATINNPVFIVIGLSRWYGESL